MSERRGERERERERDFAYLTVDPRDLTRPCPCTNNESPGQPSQCRELSKIICLDGRGRREREGEEGELIRHNYSNPIASCLPFLIMQCKHRPDMMQSVEAGRRKVVEVTGR